ncbi:hypothetical protein IFR04_014533 [Cadophora malorum]|uniref:Alcohol dehydrogenase-like C-terminal domain-containing protein n=1 Tax=Cadophora malorum TaxID=108018 RepID=A0A8H7T3I9_9HELO|nr:hypothetical protein IFR04_014533 [Cadophora malorum]
MVATHTVNPDSAKGGLKEATKEHHREFDGFDVVIEAVGVPATLAACQDLVGKGGAIANVGVHGAKVDLRLEELWGRGIQITMALVDTSTLPIRPSPVDEALRIREAKHKGDDHSRFSEMLKAYDTFGKARKTRALKVNIEL